MSTSPRLSLYELVEDLTSTTTHREPFAMRSRNGTTWTATHVTRVPSLVAQLRDVTPVSSGEAGFGGFGSRPAALLEAIDALIHIDLAASRWVRDLGEDDPDDTEGCIRKVRALHASAHRCQRSSAHRNPETREIDCCTQHSIEADVRQWWTQARILTGWDSAAWKPDNTCPLCGKRGTLRIKLAVGSGMCIECRETWDETTIGLLADHIRDENADQLESSATP